MLIYVLTGPNRGGKSVITVALGAAVALCQLGLPVPCEYAEISPVDGIFTHFPEGADDTIDKGRLGEECARLREIFDSVTENSLILLDESLSSTGAYEASYIASEILKSFAVIGSRGIFSTHLHELAASVPEINLLSIREGGVSVDNVAEWIKAGAVAVGAGGSLTAGAKTGNYKLITETGREFVERIKEARASL